MDKAAEILKEAAELKVKKSKDYQGGMWKESDYFPFKDVSYIHMMWTKMLRIRSVSEQADTNFESLEDSLLDMINYSAMYIAFLRDQKKSIDKWDKENTLNANDDLSMAEVNRLFSSQQEMERQMLLWDKQRKHT